MTAQTATHIPQLIHLAQEAIEVARLAPAPTLNPVTVDNETTFVNALRAAASTGLLPGVPPDSFSRALARASTVDTSAAATRLRTGIVTNLTDSADVAVLRTAFAPLTALPGDQPRGGSAGGRRTQPPEPRAGHDAHAAQLGLRVLAFEDTNHLRAWCADALSRSLSRAIKRGRPQEIAATGVRQPVSASMVLLQFADGTAPQWVPMLSDGISRLAVCAAGLLGRLHEDPSTAAEAIARQMLPVESLGSSSPAHELARRMRRNHQKFVHNYERHLDENGADEHAVTMRQFLTLPADLHLLATNPATGDPHPMEQAMEAVVSDHHTGVDGWGHEDESRHTALRALKRLKATGAINEGFYDLCANRADLFNAAQLRSAETVTAADSPGGTEAGPSTGPAVSIVVTGGGDSPDQDRLLLRRAVTITATLLGPSTYTEFKAALRVTSGHRRLTMNQVVDFLAPLVCEPWGTLKPITRAWAYGGPVPTWTRETPFTPAHPDDYLDLVTVASDPSASATAMAARLELAIAGGTALIADGILTTTLVGGSGASETALPFRGPVNIAIEALTCTEVGLTALAVAANHFRPSKSVRSARLPAIDLSRADKVSRDGVGVPVRTTETVLAGYAAQAAATQGGSQAQPSATSAEPTPLQNLQARAHHLPHDTRSLLRNIELTKTLHDETGGPSGLTEHDLDTVHDSLSRALKLVGRLS